MSQLNPVHGFTPLDNEHDSLRMSSRVAGSCLRIGSSSAPLLECLAETSSL
jgi:hypothetical protein